MWASDLARHLVSSPAWLVGSLMVLALASGILPDIDHPLAVLLGLDNARFLHPYFAITGLVLVGIGFILLVSCICRLHGDGVLR